VVVVPQCSQLGPSGSEPRGAGLDAWAGRVLSRSGISRWGQARWQPQVPTLVITTSFLGESAALIVRGALTTPDVVRVAVTAFADAGCDELILFPCSSELDQLDRLAEVTLDH
jgi:hypothetical protein